MDSFALCRPPRPHFIVGHRVVDVVQGDRAQLPPPGVGGVLAIGGDEGEGLPWEDPDVRDVEDGEGVALAALGSGPVAALLGIAPVSPVSHDAVDADERQRADGEVVVAAGFFVAGGDDCVEVAAAVKREGE